MQKAYVQFEHVVTKGARWVALLGLSALCLVAFATVFDILSRWLFNSPITGISDAASLFVAITVASSFPAGTSNQAHITIKLLNSIFSPETKWKCVFEIFGNVVALLIFSLMAWQLWLYANELSFQKETTMVLGWPLSPWWRLVSIILGYCVLSQLIVTCNSIRSVLAGKS